MWIFNKEEQENFDDFQEETYILDGEELKKQEEGEDNDNDTKGNE